MAKNNPEIYTIKDISDRTGIHPQTLRNWEKEGLINPIRVAGNQRIYKEEHLKRIEEILNLKDEGFQLKGIRNVLVGKHKSTKPTGRVGRPPKTRATHMVAAQTLEETRPTSTTSKRRGRPPKVRTYTEQELNTMNLKQLTDIAQEVGVKYFRQMFKEELVMAIAHPDKREEMTLQAKERTQERYGGKVYGERRKQTEENQDNKLMQLAQEQQEVEGITNQQQVSRAGLVEANEVQQATEEQNKQQELIDQILKLGQTGKSPKEIAKILVETNKE